MKAPTVRVLKEAEKRSSDMQKAIYMIAALTNQTEDEVEALDLKDYMSLQRGLQDFLEEAGAVA
ncbi:MAG: phage tail assembly protein [Wolinella sp.]